MEKICRALLAYCLLHYRGDENIKSFIWDLITPSEDGTTKTLTNHSGKMHTTHLIRLLSGTDFWNVKKTKSYVFEFFVGGSDAHFAPGNAQIRHLFFKMTNWKTLETFEQGLQVI